MLNFVEVCFCVLHYLSFKTTCDCIDSILQLDSIDTCRIIVLDNGSNNDSFPKLQKRYGGNKYINLYRSENGLGFSEGNNYMYRIAKSMHPKYVVELNNDITIEQKDFVKKLNEVNGCGDYFVIGPDIYDKNVHAHQSPIVKKLPSIDELDLTMQKKREQLSFLGGGGKTPNIKTLN